MAKEIESEEENETEKSLINIYQNSASLKVLSVILVIIMLLSVSWAGGLFDGSEEKKKELKPEPTPFDSLMPISVTTFYHYAGGVNATKAPYDALVGDNIPFLANGTYYGIGTTTFEPTIGCTSKGSLFITSHNGLGEGTHIIRSQDQAQTWVDVGPFDPAGIGGQVKNSNDPYLYVDPWTDRLVKFDMHALAGMTYEYSDDEGETWDFHTIATGESPQDHQTIASMPPPPGFIPPVAYPTIYVYSINTGLQGGGVGGSYGSTSYNGGEVWNQPELPHYEIGKSPASGLSGHLVGANDGKIYRGQPAGNYDPAMYRSTDGGFIWTEHIISTITGSQTHEIAIGTDEENNVHAFWIGGDNLPYYSNSEDFGDTWREALMMAPPGITGTGFPTIAGGAGGRAAFAYIGQIENGTWTGFLGAVTDGFAEQPLITTVAVNTPDDPLDLTDDCGYRRCGGFGDFIDICIDPDGRPWAAMAHNPSGETGIVGTYSEGPALRGELRNLDPLPIGGPSTLEQYL